MVQAGFRYLRWWCLGGLFGVVGLPLGLGSSHRVGPILAGRFGVSGNVARPAEYVFCVDARKIVESVFLMGCFGSVVVAGRCHRVNIPRRWDFLSPFPGLSHFPRLTQKLHQNTSSTIFSRPRFQRPSPCLRPQGGHARNPSKSSRGCDVCQESKHPRDGQGRGSS